MPDVKHAELIGGIVHMPSPVSRPHSRIHSPLAAWIATYVAYTPGCDDDLEATWKMGLEDVPQPDGALSIQPECGGQSYAEGEYGAGAPELIVEVANSSRAKDLGSKRELYERMKVIEYLVAVTSQKRLIWHQWSGGRYRIMEPDADGIYRSRCFPGLWLDPQALWKRDVARMLEVLHPGLASPEHAAFAARLKARR